ncbi:MAG TPA: hypothetical protein VGR67_11045 [Candidatus Polarisedimenticolia bacterium]|nr:hypothetical protein [Candidatus Polarisedimenticolia bacterium]
MMSIFRKLLAAWTMVVFGLAAGQVLAGGPEQHRTARRVAQGSTTEPAPPLSLDVKLTNLQKNSSGGVATISLDASSTVVLEGVSVSMNLPDGVIFSDGSRSKSWTFDLAAGGTLKIPADLLVSADGKYVVSAEAISSYKAKPVHRGSSLKLLVGVQEKTPPSKDGAIEFQGVPGGGM